MAESRVGAVLVFHPGIDEETAKKVLERVNHAIADSFVRTFPHNEIVPPASDFI